MAEKNSGRRLAIPRSRALVIDLLHFEKSVPTVAHDRNVNLASVRSLRENTGVSWPALFIKAFGIVSQEFPILRQCYMKWPWPHLYEHPFSVAVVAVSREYREQEWLFFAPIERPEQMSLYDLQQRIENYKKLPVEHVFGTQVRASALPTMLRRILWWYRINISGLKRAKRLGTFGLTTISGQGATIQNPPGILTSTMTYGPIEDDGNCRLTISYDHRLFDGLFVARVLQRTEEVLCGVVADELASMPGLRAVAPLSDEIRMAG